jgi:hypothetical protein
VTVAPPPLAGPTWDRLEDQIGWYDRKSEHAQRWYKLAKAVELVVAASVPPLAALGAWTWIVSVAASVVIVLEGFQHLFQWNERWIEYRSTCEDLRHEHYLFLARAGPYAGVADPQVLLAERVEGLVSKEQAKWVSTQRQAAKMADRQPPPAQARK